MKNTLVFLFAVSIVTKVFPQTEKFDIASFIPPPGWQRTDTNGTVSFFDAKTANGLTSFCQIILYPSSNSPDNANKNFKTAWQNLIVTPTKSKAKPATQTEQTPDGWTIVTGSANISFPGMNYKTILVCISGFGKTMPVQVNTAGGDYLGTLDKFFNELDLDSKTTAVANQQNNSLNKNQMNMDGTIKLSDYDFIAPDKWQLQKNKDHLLIQNMQSGCAIRILEPQPSSGDLEKDAKTVFDMMYTGWQYQKTRDQQYILSKGFLPKGMQYSMIEAPMSTTSTDGQYQLEEGVALVVKAGAQIIIISARHNSSMLAHGDCQRKYETWRRFFNSFTVKNVTVPKSNEEDVSNRIVGAWSQTESGASSEYVFAANGHYAFYGAIGTTSTSRDYNYEYLHIKTYAFNGDGSYAISGNQLTLKKQSDSNPEQMRFRFAKVSYGGAGWKERLYMLTKDRFGENEVCYEKRNK